nr:hypothetical protein GCM10020093_075220 [Planobispora longispora]
MATARSLSLGLLALTDVVLTVVVVLMIVLSFALGLVFLFPPGTRMLRRRTALARRLSGRWLGREIGPSYLPPPPPVRRQPDGWYRHDRQLYKTPRVPEWNNRWKWMFGDPATWRDLLWVTLNPLLGAALLLPVIAIGYAVPTARQGHPVALLLGLMAVAATAAAPWLLRFYGWWNEMLLGPTAKSLLASRIHSLNQAHLETADSQAAELRRIERDLHDGAQARLVAIGMTLGAVEALVETDPTAAKALLGKAREASSTALTELRGLVRGIHPPVLSERGLGDAVRALALDSPLEVKVTVDLKTRPEPPVESAAYFSVSELLTNAVRHGARTASGSTSATGEDPADHRHRRRLGRGRPGAGQRAARNRAAAGRLRRGAGHQQSAGRPDDRHRRPAARAGLGGRLRQEGADAQVEMGDRRARLRSRLAPALPAGNRHGDHEDHRE